MWCLLKTLRKTNGLDPSNDGISAGSEFASTKFSGLVRGEQPVSQDQLYILASGIAGSDVRRGDQAVSVRSCARNAGQTG